MYYKGKTKRKYSIECPNAATIEDLKNRLADRDMSPKQFFDTYYRKFDQEMGYSDFCRMVNWDDIVNLHLIDAINDFIEDCF